MDDYRQQQYQQQQQQHYSYQQEAGQGPRLDGGHHSTHARYGGHTGGTAHAQYPMGASGSGYAWNGYAAAPGMNGIAGASLAGGDSAARAGVQTGKMASGGTQPLRIKISERLQQIDREAFETEERRYQQKGEEIHSEVGQILRGTHPAFVEGIARLASERDRMVQSAEQSHRYLVDLYTKAYAEERAVAEKAYAEERQMVYDKIAADIDERRRRLKEEKDSLDISMDFVFEAGSRTSSKRNLRRRGMDSLLGGGENAGGAGGAGAAGGGGGGGSGGRSQSKRKNNQTLSMQGVSESEMISDLTAIRQATGVTGPLATATHGKKSAKGGKR